MCIHAFGVFFLRPTRPQEWPEPSHPCWQLSAGPRGQWMLEGTTSLHLQRLQVQDEAMAQWSLSDPSTWCWVCADLYLSFFFSAHCYIWMEISKEGSSYSQKWTPKQWRWAASAQIWALIQNEKFELVPVDQGFDAQSEQVIDSVSTVTMYFKSLGNAFWTSPLSLLCHLPPLQASVKPKCGRMVGFSSGGENPHGVKAITRGQRCAVALWFTLDPLFRELVDTVPAVI